MNHKIRKVDGYMTTDGMVHADAAAAEKRQNSIDLREGMASIASDFYYSDMSLDCLIDALVERAESMRNLFGRTGAGQ